MSWQIPSGIDGKRSKFLLVGNADKRKQKSVGRFLWGLMERAGLEIATHWSPMRPKLEHWRLNFQNWSPAGDSRFVR